MDEMQINSTAASDAGNRDYKYMLQDVSTIYLGAKYTYGELIEEKDIPFKVKTLINGYVRPELERDGIDFEKLPIDSHFYFMEGKGYLYQTFLQLKVKVKFSILEEKKSLFAKTRSLYVTRVLRLEDFVKMTPAEKEEKNIYIQEISMSKLALMGI